MMLNSVVTLVKSGNDDCDHFLTMPGQRRFGGDDSPVQIYMLLHHRRIDAGNPDYVSRAFITSAVHFVQSL